MSRAKKTTVATQEIQARQAMELNPALRLIRTLNSENILEVKNYLIDEYMPKSVSEAIVMKNIQHLFKTADKNISKGCEEVLDECEFCDSVRIDPDTGLKVLRKNKPQIKEYNSTPEIREIESQLTELEYEMKELKEKLKEARERAGYVAQHNGHTYTVKF